VNVGGEYPYSPCSVSWNTTTATNGSHTVTAVARDAAGNVTTSSAVIVTVSNGGGGGGGGGDTTAPTVSLTAPAAGSTVSTTISVTANATDNVGVAGVQFKLDGANLGAEATTAPYSVSWNATAATNGSHTLTAVARDAAGNVTTSAAVSVTVSGGLVSTGGIASRFPGDVGIENDPSVIFAEKFNEAALSDVFTRWGDVLNGAAMLLGSDVPAGSGSGSRSLEIPSIAGVNTGGHLYKMLSTPVDTLYVRYYIKYPTNATPHHSGIWMGGFNPASAWPDPQAGSKPNGSDRFIAGAEQNTVIGSFDHYNYWVAMHPDGVGSYWGNFLLNNPNVQATTGQWMCVEHMVKLNNPTTAFNGEHEIWLNGVVVSHLTQGSPNGTWSGGIFTQNPAASTTFEGFQWRTDANLRINWIWLQNYSPADSLSLKFANVVAATSYIGCLP
jgi:YD repeat-containing protein